jgi:hypothetical protein
MMDDFQILMSVIGVTWEVQGGKGGGGIHFQYFFDLK